MRRKKLKVWRDYHHIVNKCNGGGNHPSNLLLIKISRHRALHTMFGHQNLNDIYWTIKKINFRGIVKSSGALRRWQELFGDKTKTEALQLIARLIRAKEAQRRK